VPSDRRTETALRRDSHVALYAQVADLLKQEIAAGPHPASGRLPSEHELMRRFGISRVTVRQAVDLLIKEGLVVRKQGKGTYLGGSTVRHELQELRGFYDVMAAQGLRPETRLLRFELVAPPPDVLARLGSESGELMLLQRLYSLEGAPIGLATTWLPAQARRVTWEQAETHPSYSILQQLLGIRIARASIAIRGRLAGRSLARVLKLSSKSAVLVLERTSYDREGRPRELTDFVVNSESYEFTLSAEGPLPINSGLRAASSAA
jgi:DNA-binding GntR family transcriptional regulator